MDFIKKVRAIVANKNLSNSDRLNFIKQQISPGDYKSALKLHPLFKNSLNSKPYFNDIDDIYIKEPLAFSANFAREYRWIVNIVENFLDDINIFIGLKNNFESYIILDEIELAISVLNDIELKFGISLWSIEANLIIQERTNGSEANWNKLTFYLNQIKNPFYEFIINSSSKRVELKLSYESYINQFQNDLDNANAPEYVEDFLVFKNLSFASYEYSYPNLESVLYISNIFSIIDQYLILIDVINYNISESNTNDNLFRSFISNAREVVNNDKRLINLANILNVQRKESFVKQNNNDFFVNCLNQYYSGNFLSAFENSSIGIKENPTEFEYYEIYCKSLINLRSEFISCGLSVTIDTILEDIYGLLIFNDESEDNIKRVLKTSLFWMNSSFGRQSFALLLEIRNIKDKFYNVGALSSTTHNTKSIYVYRQKNIDVAYLLSLGDGYKAAAYALGIDVTNKNWSKSKFQNIMIEANHLYNSSRFLEAVELLINFSEFDDFPYYYEKKISILFQSYMHLKSYSEALVLFGNIFFSDTLYTQKINPKQLFNNIEDLGDKKDFEGLIDLPILYSLIIKEYDLYEVYDDFMVSHSIYSLNDIVISNFIENFSLKLTIYFLHNVATIDTIKYSTDYGSISEVEEDRIKILRWLIELDISNKLQYEKEINEIYRINSVRKVLKEVDEGRLYIDVDNLKEIQVKKFNDDFKRYKEIETFSSSQSLIGFNPSISKNWERTNKERTEANEIYNSADYLAFKSIYLESRENFLFSKEYGLDSSLSTRIRHGALKNHIRSVFEKLDLVTSKHNDKYKDNLTWQRQLLNFPDLNYDLQIKLKSFSRQIDDYTLFIVDNLVQIQTEKTLSKNEGLFTFYTNDDILFKFFKKNKSFFTSIESTIEIILTSLTNRTLVELQNKIAKYFTEVILLHFQTIIDNLISAVRVLNLPHDCQLLPFLLKSHTDIQNELESIANWFYLNTTTSKTLLDIETIVDASIELTNKINPNFRITPTVVLNCPPFAVYSNLIFVFNILLKNVIEHSKLTVEEVVINITFDIIEQKYIRVTFKNNLSHEFNMSVSNARLATIKANWNDHTNIERSNKEGESGFDKIKRMLIYETFSKTDKFDFFIEKNWISIQLFFPYLKYNDNE